MTNSNWTKQGETLSHKNACKEFDLTEEQILAAMRSGELEFKKNYAHGNPYFRLLRKQVESLAKKLHGNDNLKANKVRHDLKVVTREINSLKRKLSSLGKTKIQLTKTLDKLEISESEL